MQSHFVYRTLPWLYPLPPIDGKHGREGQPCRCNILILQKSISLWSFKHNRTCCHPLNLHGYKLTENKTKVISFGCTPSHTCSKCWRASLPCPCMAHPPSMTFQVTISQDIILWNTFQASSMLLHVAHMSTKIFPTKTSNSQPFWMSFSSANLPSSRATMLAHAFSTPTKVTEFGHPHFPVAFVEVVPLPSALALISYVPISWQSKWPHFEMATCWTLSKHPQGSHILHTCQPSYSPQRLQTLNHFEQTVHEQACHLQ